MPRVGLQKVLRDVLVDGGASAKELPSEADLAVAFKVVDADKSGKKNRKGGLVQQFSL